MRFTITPLVLAGLAACNLPDTELTIIGVAANDDPPSCELAEPTEDALKDSSHVLDVGGAFAISVALVVRNELTGLVSEDIDDTQRSVELRAANDIQPLRFFARWECDANGFANGEGPLILPTFDPNNPFCLDRRGDINTTFAGLDVVPAHGPSIAAGGNAHTIIEAVPFELGRAFFFLFDIAVRASQCCQNSTNCDGRDRNPTPGMQPCLDLQNLFAVIDPTARVQSDAAGTPSPLLVRYQRFAVYDGNYAAFSLNLPVGGSRYPLRLHGVLEGVDGSGSLMRSNDTTIEIQACRDCGPQQREPTQCQGGTQMGPKVYVQNILPAYFDECGELNNNACVASQ